jgi:hypothetical protein
MGNSYSIYDVIFIKPLGQVGNSLHLVKFPKHALIKHDENASELIAFDFR